MRTEARIIDASANRAREGLRLLEDLARFGLEDPGLTEEIKAIRHGVTAGVASLDAAGLDRGELLGGRDTPGDVGTGISGGGELTRGDLFEAAAAAAGRAAEAVRSLEEVAKVLGCAHASRDFEALRYRVYEVERRVGTQHLGPHWRLCVVLSESLCVRAWEEVVRESVLAGADCVQLREKTMGGRELLARARRLVAVVDEMSGDGGVRAAAVIVNDRPDVAVAAGADGVHVGQGDMSAADCRAVMGLGKLVGVSASSMERARAAATGPVSGRASSCGVGAMFMTGTKADPHVVGPGLLRAYLADEVTARVPHLAIGGITPENVCELAKVGVRGVAVSSAVCGDRDPGGVCRALVDGMMAGADSGGGLREGTAR